MNKCRYCSNQNLLAFFNKPCPLYLFPLKKTEKNLLLSERQLFTTTLTYKYCFNCGLIFSSISQNENRVINEIYERFYNYISPLASKVASSEIDSFLEEVNIFFKKARCVLEIGCFDGYLLYHLKKRGVKVVGIDPSENGAKIAKEHGIKIINEYFPYSKIKHKKFDIIFSRHVIEHVESPFSFLEEQIKILDKNGIAIFETPNPNWFILEGNDEAFHPQHKMLLTSKFITRILEDLNVKNSQIKTINHRVIVFFSEYPFNDLLVPISKLKEKMKIESLKLESKLNSFQKKIETKMNFLEQLISKHINKNKIAIWGAGSFTANLLIQLDELSKIHYIIDSDPKKWDMEFLHSDIPIFSPDLLLNENIDVLFIFSQFADEIITYLRKNSLVNRIPYIYKFFPKFEVVAK